MRNILENMELSKINKIHFIGIGGIGISAIARMMILDGKNVSGSDASLSIVTEELRKIGAEIFMGHSGDNIKDVDFVVYTTAIAKDNPELQKAINLNIPTYSYPQMLGFVSAGKFTIAVSGTHGKTTTTAMIAKILMDANLDPTVIVGSLLKDEKSNLVIGKSKYFVVEACEYRRAFLNLIPRIIVITNIEEDHLDYYKDISDIQRAFSEFISKLEKEDLLVCNIDDDNLRAIIKLAKCKIVDYSSQLVIDLKLKVPGRHNLENAKAALAVARHIGVDDESARHSLENFSGTWRRFEYKGQTNEGALIYDDYAHHPTEIKATLKGAREFFGDKKIFCVFQPHLFSRTRFLLEEFSKSFSDADTVLIADIYASRETDDGQIHSRDLAKKISQFSKNVIYLESFEKIGDYLKSNIKSGDVIITMGAGDIYQVTQFLELSTVFDKRLTS